MQDSVQKHSLWIFRDLSLYSGCVLAEVIPTDKVEVGFKDLDAAILVGSMPRKEGMERKDLLKANVAIFKTQGAALDKYAKKTVKVRRRGEGEINIYYSFILDSVGSRRTKEAAFVRAGSILFIFASSTPD